MVMDRGSGTGGFEGGRWAVVGDAVVGDAVECFGLADACAFVVDRDAPEHARGCA